MATSNFSTLDELNNLCASIPDWNTRLDELNGQIALRQIELARLEEHERPPTRSIKNQGSTESLRPRDGNENPFSSQDDEEDIQMTPFKSKSPQSPQNGFSSVRRPSSSKAARAAAVVTPPPPKASSNPRPSPGALLTRQSSQPTPPTQPRVGPAALRKRKTDSLASGESAAPKYRTRSMIIVYYDSTVQNAFEEMVKFVSASRNALRKGKIAAKMAGMRRAAELEVEAEEAEDKGVGHGLNEALSNGNMLAARKNVNVGKEGQSLAAGEDDGDEEFAMPKLKFVSTRQMGPPRTMTPKAQNFGSDLTARILGGYRRAGGGPSIFDELDEGLEFCQKHCEQAAHQFLRDGECSTEIETIRKKLSEVKKSAEKEVERLKKEDASNPATVTPAQPSSNGKGREFKTPHIRRELGNLKDLEVDDMEVDDDEGVDDLQPPPKLIFKRSGQD